jgi:hypothetical protein
LAKKIFALAMLRGHMLCKKKNTNKTMKNTMKEKVNSILAIAIMASILGCHPAAGSCNVVIGDFMVAGNDVKWNIKNSGSSPITICSISLKWPEQNGDLLKISIDTPTIFSQNRNPTQTTIDSGWTGQESKRTINFGQTSVFKLSYENTASTIAEDYIMTVNFCPCTAEFPNSSPSECSIIGPDTVCEFENSWHNASVNEVLPFGYTYTWKVDNSIAGTGKNIQINWRPYSPGIHSLSLNVTKSLGISTYCNESYKQVQVVKKPIVKIIAN